MTATYLAVLIQDDETKDIYQVLLSKREMDFVKDLLQQMHGGTINVSSTPITTTEFEINDN